MFLHTSALVSKYFLKIIPIKGGCTVQEALYAAKFRGPSQVVDFASEFSS